MHGEEESIEKEEALRKTTENRRIAGNQTFEADISLVHVLQLKHPAWSHVVDRYVRRCA